MRWLLRLAVMIGTSAISIVGTLAWTTLHRYDKPAVPLTAGLTGDWTIIDREFGERVKARFPVGSPEAEMIAELQREGFSPADWSALPDEEHEAVRSEDNLICRKDAHVFWRTDPERRIVAIRGSYPVGGCL